MNPKLTIVISCKIESTLKEWVKIFDHSAFDIKTLFRGFSKDEPEIFIFINQAPERNIKKNFQANSEWIKRNKVDFSTMAESSWI